MSDARLDVYLLGEPQPGIDRATLVRNLATTFKKDVPVIEKMLRKSRSLLKADIDTATATKYQAVIRKAGGQCELVNHGEQLFPSEALNPVAPRSVLTVAPVEPTALTPAVDNEAPAAATNDNLHYSSPYAAPGAGGHAPDYFCYKCGRGIAPGLPQCPYCRAPQVQLNSKSKVTAGFLAFFLGGLGAHRFYLGQWWGIFYVIFWGTLIPSIISLVEAFVFWFSSNERWNSQYGRVPAASSGFKVAVAVAGFFAFFFVTGIIAAVSLPAYQDYTVRAKVQAAMPLIDDTRQKVSDVIKQKDFFPSENLLAGLPENLSNEFVSSISLGAGAQIIVAFNIPSLDEGNNTIIWTPKREGNDIVWSCATGSMPDKYRMQECRGQANSPASNQATGSTGDMRIYSDDKKLSIETPASWKGDRNLNREAAIGVADMRESNYLVVLRESKVDFASTVSLSDYTGFIYSGLETAGTNFSVVEPVRELNINGLPAQQQALATTVEGVKITYIITTFSSESHFYVIYAWTIASRFQQNQAVLKKVSGSFSLHNGTNQ